MAYIKSKEYQEKLNNISIKTCNDIINWLNSHNGKMPRGNIFEHGRKLKRDNMTEEEIAEVNLYHRWMYTTGMQVIHEYLEMPIEEVPEEYRGIIQEIKHAVANTIIWKEVEEWLKTHNGEMPSAAVHRDKKVLKVSEMTEEEKQGVNLRQRWDRSNERKIFEMYKESPEEQIPEEYRDIIEKLKILGLGKTAYDEILEWLKTHDGIMPRGYIIKDKRNLKVSEMAEKEKYEINLCTRWSKSIEAYMFKKYKGKPIEDVPEEYREKIQNLRNNIKPTKRRTIYDEIVKWLQENNRKMPESAIAIQERIEDNRKMTEEEMYEAHLYASWNNSREKKLLDDTAGITIEEIKTRRIVSEEDIEKIIQLRELGQFGKSKDDKIITTMRQAVRRQVENNMSTREEVSKEDMLLQDNNQEEK